MTLQELLADLSRLAVKIQLKQGNLSVAAPKGVITPLLRKALRAHKAELVAMLRRRRTNADVTSWPLVVSALGQRYQPFPLTDIQQAYWLGRGEVFELGNVTTHSYVELAYDNLNVELLSAGWQQLIERHEMLRAVVLSSGEQQILRQVPAYIIEVIDLRGFRPEEVAAQLNAIRAEMSHQVLPADQWPLFDIRVTRLAQNEMRLHLSLDLLVLDLASIIRLFQEWQQLYHNPDIIFPALELSFRDYVVAERLLQDTLLYHQAREYWFRRLDTLPSAPELPLAQNPTSIKQPRFKSYQAQLSSQEWRQLKQRAAQIGLTPSGVLLAAFAEILTVWSKTPRFSLNLTLFNRLPLHPQVNDIIGDFTSTILLSVDNATSEPFSERALRVQRQLWQDLEHRYVSGVQVLREMTRKQGSEQRVVMPVVFTSSLALDAAYGENNTRLEPFGKMIYSISQTPQVWLDCQIYEQEGTLFFNWDVIEALFPENLIKDMFGAYCGLLKQLATTETVWQATTRDLLPQSQLEQRVAVNATQRPIPTGLLHSQFEIQVFQRPDHPAVIASKRRLTYQDLNYRANQVGQRLRQLGARPNKLVAVVMEKGWEQVVAVLGILKAGAAYLPIDPHLPQERQWYLLEYGQVELVLTQSWLDDQLTWPKTVQRLCVDDESLAEMSTHSLEPVQKATDLAYVIFTSGSTGLPKGVMIDHRGVLNTVLDINQRFQVTWQDRVLALSALNFDLSVYDIFGILAAGGTMVIPNADAGRDPAHWAEIMQREQVTLWNTVPTLMQMLVEYAAGQPDLRLNTLRLVMLSGDWIPVSLPDQIRALWQDAAVVSLGGATEASIWSILYPIKEVKPTWTSIPYGRPMVNQQFHVLDQTLEPCPVWVPGQLYIGGIGLAQGYWRDEEKTTTSFITHPHIEDNNPKSKTCTERSRSIQNPKSPGRLYKTGDLGRYLPDGNIEFLGREDFQIKIRGHRIELGEIEATLVQHPDIADAIVNAVGESSHNKQLVAYVIPEPENAPNFLEIERANPEQLQQRWQSLVKAGRHQAQQGFGEQPLQDFSVQWEEMDHLYPRAVCRALVKLGVYRTIGEKYDVDALISHCQITLRYKKWLHRALQALVKEGWLQQQGELFESVVPLSTIVMPEPSVESKANPFFDFIKTVDNLAELLTEEAHVAEIYASEQTQSSLQSILYFCNLITKAVIQSVVQSLEPGQQIRILEVGAGYGVTTTQILPILPPKQTTYIFTDISRFFLEKAKEKFTEYPFMHYSLLDLDKNPKNQGYQAHTFDIIIASGVLHNVRFIQETMGYIHSLLAPGGLLLMIEATKFYRWFDLMMGLQHGFEQFEDKDLRPNHPLLSREQWQNICLTIGFEKSVVLNQPGTLSDSVGFDVLVAQGLSSVKRFNPGSLRDFLQGKLPQYMVPASYILLDTWPLTANGKLDRKALPEPITDRPELEKDFILPRTAIEEQLVKIWINVLGLKQISVHDNFFEVGGDSLLATQIASKIRKHFPIELSALFSEPTIAKLANYIEMTWLTDKLQSPGNEALGERETIEL